ncbi:MAG: hypothetical protein H6R10_3261 [Rhodocyclaceae bacterium]|nr:hypothetical protein [Rhodocyclaceae bacterium]
MRFRPWLLCLAAVPLLAACVDDSASYQNESKDQSLTLIRQQRWLWDKTVDAAVVVSRLPDCQRRHNLEPLPPQARVELWQPGSGTFVIRRGDNNAMILTETQTCEGWQNLPAEPPGGLGRQLGTFDPQDGKLRFVPAGK